MKAEEEAGSRALVTSSVSVAVTQAQIGSCPLLHVLVKGSTFKAISVLVEGV